MRLRAQSRVRIFCLVTDKGRTRSTCFRGGAGADLAEHLGMAAQSAPRHGPLGQRVTNEAVPPPASTAAGARHANNALRDRKAHV